MSLTNERKAEILDKIIRGLVRNKLLPEEIIQYIGDSCGYPLFSKHEKDNWIYCLFSPGESATMTHPEIAELIRPHLMERLNEMIDEFIAEG